MFGIGLVLAFALLDGYVLWRLGGVPWLAHEARRRWLLALGALLLGLFAAARFLARGPRAPALRVLLIS